MSEEFIDIDIDIDGKVMPQVTEQIALIDADTLAYTSCLLTEQCEDLLPKEMYTDEEYEEIINSPEYDEETNARWTNNIDEAYVKAMEKLQRIYDKTGCRECEMHFTGGRENFRYEVATDYKANRSGFRTPAGLRELKDKLLENFDGSMATQWEADDIVVYKKVAEPEKYIMVAIDKDLLFSVEGKHFNYYESAKYNIEMKWMECDADTKMKWPFMQAMVGDKVDNITGIPGIGPKKAEKALIGCQTESECWDTLVDMYENAGMTAVDALVTVRLVHMHQFNGEEIVLWDPRESIDKAYKKLGMQIINNGIWQEGRNGRTLSLFGTQLKYDLSNGFPLLNMRKIFHKGVVGEFISFLQDSKNVAEFEANGCPYWKLWAGENGELVLDYPPRAQLDYAINLIKNEPASRRILIDLWNPDNRGKLSLDPCHTQYQFSVRQGKLDMVWTQRSVDFAIGAPSDFILAALYVITIANECDLIPGEITFNFGDTHLYEEHIELFTKLLRDTCYGTSVGFRLTDSIYNFTKESLEIVSYHPKPAVKFELKA